jgi:beta-glucanase (GH16 family)
MRTQGLFWKTYGRIEWRASLPKGTGFWPALWSLGTNINSIGWPGCGEIDVVENNGTPTFVQGSIHSGSDATGYYYFPAGQSVTNFHVYDLDWTTNATGGVSITWSVDGTAYETQTSWSSSTGTPYPFPFDQPFFFLMNLAIGGSYLGNPSTNAINPNLPGDMVIDYMRVYNYVTVPVTNPPATPTGLTATPGGWSVGLNWNPAANATSYNVKRATTSGGSYNTIVTTTATNYTDTSVASCATYYYEVSGTNSLGESSNSAPASATVGQLIIAVNSGGSAASPFVADTDVTGGTVATTSTATIVTSNVTNPAPQAVYKTERYNDFYYNFTGLNTGLVYTVRLHDCEIYFTGPGEREFNVFINGVQVLTNFDIFATAGGENIAVIKQYSVMPKANGMISIAYSNGAVDDAKSSGIEIVLPAPTAPTGLTTTGEFEQVALVWSAVPGPTSYDVYRSEVSGGPYTNLASGVTNTNYTDTGLADGTPYYYVVTTVEAGCQSTNSVEVSATTATPLTPFQEWQSYYFGSGSATNPLAAANADPLGKGISNTNQFLLGLNPTNPASTFSIVAITSSGGTNTITWNTSGGDPNAAAFGGPTVITNIVQGSVGTPDGEYTNNFSNISGPLIIVPAGDTATNYPDASGTNFYYRILAP